MSRVNPQSQRCFQQTRYNGSTPAFGACVTGIVSSLLGVQVTPNASKQSASSGSLKVMYTTILEMNNPAFHC